MKDETVSASLAAKIAMAFSNRPTADSEVTADEVRGLGSEVRGYHGYDRLGGSSPAAPGRFALDPLEDGSYGFRNPYYDVGGKTYVAAVSSVSVTDGYVALSITMKSTFPTASIVTYQTFSEMQNAQKGDGTYVLPLYKFTGGDVECDFRLGPPAVSEEFPS